MAEPAVLSLQHPGLPQLTTITLPLLVSSPPPYSSSNSTTTTTASAAPAATFQHHNNNNNNNNYVKLGCSGDIWRDVGVMDNCGLVIGGDKTGVVANPQAQQAAPQPTPGQVVVAGGSQAQGTVLQDRHVYTGGPRSPSLLCVVLDD